MIACLALLFSNSWVMGLTESWITLFSYEISARDIILIGGGIFLVAKATHEIHNSLEGVEEQKSDPEVTATSMGMVLLQITLKNIVFSFNSVTTAVGFVDEVSIMAIAIVLAVLVMLLAAESCKKTHLHFTGNTI